MLENNALEKKGKKERKRDRATEREGKGKKAVPTVEQAGY